MYNYCIVYSLTLLLPTGNPKLMLFLWLVFPGIRMKKGKATSTNAYILLLFIIYFRIRTFWYPRIREPVFFHIR